MLNKLKQQMSDIKLLILNIIIIILVLLSVLVLSVTIEEVHTAFSTYEARESSFIYAMGREEYGRMVSMYYKNCGSEDREKKKLQEYYGVAKYYEAAFYYRMYLEAEDEVRAVKQKEAMEAAVLQMGDFGFVKENIDRKLGIAE